MKTLQLTMTNRAECVVMVTACNQYHDKHPEFQPKPMVDALWNNKHQPGLFTNQSHVSFTLDDTTAELVPKVLVKYVEKHTYTEKLMAMALFHYLSAYYTAK